jgi:hypothetical protein
MASYHEIEKRKQAGGAFLSEPVGAGMRSTPGFKIPGAGTMGGCSHEAGDLPSGGRFRPAIQIGGQYDSGSQTRNINLITFSFGSGAVKISETGRVGRWNGTFPAGLRGQSKLCADCSGAGGGVGGVRLNFKTSCYSESRALPTWASTIYVGAMGLRRVHLSYHPYYCQSSGALPDNMNHW